MWKEHFLILNQNQKLIKYEGGIFFSLKCIKKIEICICEFFSFWFKGARKLQKVTELKKICFGRLRETSD